MKQISKQDIEDRTRGRKFHSTRLTHIGWEINPLPLRAYPKKPDLIDTMAVSYRLSGMAVDQIASTMRMTAKEVSAILKPWGHEHGGVFCAWPEYLPGLKIPDYLPQVSPNFDAIKRELLSEAEQIAKKECARRDLPDLRKRRMSSRRS